MCCHVALRKTFVYGFLERSILDTGTQTRLVFNPLQLKNIINYYRQIKLNPLQSNHFKVSNEKTVNRDDMIFRKRLHTLVFTYAYISSYLTNNLHLPNTQPAPLHQHLY